MTEIHGTTAAKFEAVRAAMAANFDDGFEVGASVAVTVDGEMVADLWGGHKDMERTQAWESDTITNVWSSTKTMTALCALILADRGELDFLTPVAHYWPEFAANGKEVIEVRHLMSHTSGLSGWETPIEANDLYDWEKVTSLLAAQAPWWEPGKGSGYHAITQGYLVGEVIRRVAGQSVGTFFAKEVAGPLEADFHIGLAAEHHHRVANVIPPSTGLDGQVEPGSLAARTLGNPKMAAERSWEKAWREAEIPAAGGHGNARSAAKVQTVMACGGEVGGLRLLSAKGCEAVFEEQCNGIDQVLGIELRHGIGYGLSSPSTPMPNERTHYWGGWGGSLVVVDQQNRVCVTYMMNRMGDGTVGDTRAANIVAAAYTSLFS